MAISDVKLRKLLGKPYTGPAELTDAEGLGARVSPKGVITFQYRYRWKGSAQRISIGRYPSISLQQARNIVAEFRELYFSGVDPKTSLHKEEVKQVTLKDCLNYWNDNYVTASLRPKTQQLYQSTVIKIMDGVFPNAPVDQITTRQWVDFFTKEEKANPRRARQVLSQLRSAISWCIRRQYVDSCAIMNIMPKDFGVASAVGDRVLTYTELAKVWIGIERSRAATSNKLLHQMLILWGARISELRLAVKGDFNLEDGVWTVPASNSKMGNTIRRPIFPQIEPLLEKALTTYKEYLFPGDDLNKPITIAAANRFIGRVRDLIEIDNWRTHDFRRTIATRLSEEGVMPHVIEKMLGHELGGVMAVYNKHDWIEDQRKAYELHAERLFEHIKKLSD